MKKTWTYSEICEKNDVYVNEYACEESWKREDDKDSMIESSPGGVPKRVAHKSTLRVSIYCASQVRGGDVYESPVEPLGLRLDGAKSLNSISRARLNFRRRPFLRTTLLCRNPIQASNFGGAFDQLFLWIFLCNFHRWCLSTLSIPWCKKVKMTRNSNQGGSCQKLKSRGQDPLDLSFWSFFDFFAP